MNEARNNQESAKVRSMKSRLAFALQQMDRMRELAKTPAWKKLDAFEQELYAAENSAWKTAARIVNIHLKIEMGKAAKARAAARR